MPVLSFRLKLLLAMMAVVAGVAGATLSVSQRKFEQTQQHLFAELFRAHNQFFAERQRLLLEYFEQTGVPLAQSSRLRNMLANAEDDTKELYDRARSELETRNLLREGPDDANPFRARFFLFLDRTGAVLPPSREMLSGWRPFNQQEILQRQLRTITAEIARIEKPAAAYVATESESGAVHLQQAVFMRFLEPFSGDLLGFLALVFPGPALDGSQGGFQAIRTGILLEDRIFSDSIPTDVRPDLARAITGRVSTGTPSPGPWRLDIHGEPHRVFHQELNSSLDYPRARLVALISLKEALEAQQDLRNRIFLFGLAGLLGALLLSLMLSHGLSVPIRELVAGTGEIQRGNFSVKVPVRSRDEIGALAESFNQMAVGLALKEKYRSVLDKVADKDIAQELMRGNVALGGENREISVLFCDIRGFTAMSQGMDPAEVISMLNEHFTPLTRIVTRHRGVVDKFVGDLIMAVFGAPKSYGNDAANAARCALDIIAERRKLNEASKYRIEVGIGVASGNAVAGNMGSIDRLNYTVLGERVNLASRLCSKAGRMEIVIDQTTRERLGHEAVVEGLAELELKGFSGRVQAFKLSSIENAPPIEQQSPHARAIANKTSP